MNRIKVSRQNSLTLFRRRRSIGAERTLYSGSVTCQQRHAPTPVAAVYKVATDAELDQRLLSFKSILSFKEAEAKCKALSSSSSQLCALTSLEDPFEHDPALVRFIQSQLTSVQQLSKGKSNSEFQRSDTKISNRSKSSTVEGMSMWDEVPVEEKMDTFECNNKQAWIDVEAGWCHLCDEPVGGFFGIHVGDRDHMCLQLFLTIYANYPLRATLPDCESFSERSAKVLSQAANEKMLKPVYHYVSRPYNQDHLHTQPDAVRRAELTSLLIHLCQPPHNAITHVFQGKGETFFWYSGERMFRHEFTKSISRMLPPMSAGMMTQLTHKCWGRTNLERAYDALLIADIKRMFGGIPLDEKDLKAQFMRLLMWNLMDTPVRTLRTIPGEEGDHGEQMSPQDTPTYKIDHTELTIELSRLARRRLVFELVYLQSMQFMNKAQGIYRRLGHPTYAELMKMNVT